MVFAVTDLKEKGKDVGKTIMKKMYGHRLFHDGLDCKAEHVRIKGALAVCCTATMLLGGCSAVGFVKDQEIYPVLAETIEEGIDAGTYVALTETEYFSSPDDKDNPAGVYEAGEKIYLEGTAQNDMDVWGRTSDDCWVLISDRHYVYLPKEEEMKFEEEKVDADFVSDYAGYVDCYLAPLSDTQPGSDMDVSRGDIFHIQTRVTAPDGIVYGKLEKNKWIRLVVEDRTYFYEFIEEPETTEDPAKEIEENPYYGEILAGMEDYILPNSDSAFIETADLQNLQQTEVVLAYHEIYARHGLIFDVDYIKAYFELKDWYQPEIEPGDFSDEVLNEFEKANINLIASYEMQMGWR